jgi:hypothetical protein
MPTHHEANVAAVPARRFFDNATLPDATLKSIG